MNCLWIWVRSITFLFVFYTTSAILLVVFIPTLFMGRKITYWMPWVWTRWFRLLLKWICGIKINVMGLENLPQKNGYIVASKHQSALETLIFHTIVPNVFFVFKKELLWLPIAGLYALFTKCVPIDRGGGGATLRKMFTRVSENLKNGLNLIIFPEGTRTKPGEKNPYSPGIALLYDQCQAPVVPVALNTGYFWPKNSTKKYAGTVIIAFLKPIEPGLHKRAFLDELYDRIEEVQDTFKDPFEGRKKC